MKHFHPNKLPRKASFFATLAACAAVVLYISGGTAPQANSDTIVHAAASLPAICAKPKVDLMLVMDNSGSMNNSNSGAMMKDVIGSFINDGQGVSKFQDGDRLGGIRFGWNGNTDAERTKTTDTNAASKAIMTLSDPTITATTNRGLEILSNTYLTWAADTSQAAPGLRQASDYLRTNKATDAIGVVILFTEGGDNGGTDFPDVGSTNYNDLLARATADKAQDIYYYNVGLKNLKTAVENVMQAGGGFAAQLNSRDITEINNTTTSIFKSINGRFDKCVSVTKEANKTLVRPGDAPNNTFTLTYRITNNRRTALINSLLRDDLPSGMTFSDGKTFILSPIAPTARGGSQTVTANVTVNN